MDIKLVTTIEGLPAFDPNLPIFCDIESDGLYVNPRIIQYYQPETDPSVYILDLNYFGDNTKSNTSAMFRALGREQEVLVTREQLKEYHQDKWLVWWNGCYDQGTLRFTSEKVDDLWYMAKLGLPRLGNYTLDAVVAQLLPGQNPYEHLDKRAMQKSNWGPGKLSEEQLQYAASDVYVMKKLWDKLAPIIADTPVYRLDMSNQKLAVQWQQTGLKVHRPKHQEAYIDTTKRLAASQLELPGLNVNSYKQVRALLSKHQGQEVTASDESTLLYRVANGCPYSKEIINQRKILKTISFLNNYNHDKVYGHYNPYGTRTGRWSCKGGDAPEYANLQQLPRALKWIFGHEDDTDMVFVGADLPTAELRLAAAVYVDDSMVNAFLNNIDVHSLTASKTIGCNIEDVSGEQRKKAKAENFGLLYGMKANKFREYAFTNYGIEMDDAEAMQRRSNWMKSYPGIARKIETVSAAFFEGKNRNDPIIVRTPLGRKVQPDMYTDALNIPIQGAVAEVSKLWLHYLHEMHGSIVPVANFVHDSVTIECTQDKAKYWEQLLYDSCNKAWEQYCKLPDIKVKEIPMPIEVGISKSYKGAS